ncbi:MAG: hypothetical protein OXE99_11610, partial [Cellvibrionales bacterium]|nr:hypothetical protein [Cellvibrionales bacterium]
ERRYHYKLLSLAHVENHLATFLASQKTSHNDRPSPKFASLWKAYRLSLSAEIKAIKSNNDIENIDHFIARLAAIQQLFSDCLPSDDYTNDFDDILNWHTYQTIQRLIVFCDKKQEKRLLQFVEPLKKMTRLLLKQRRSKHFLTPRNSKQLSEFLEVHSHKKSALQLTTLLEEQSSTIGEHYQTIFLGIIAAAAMLTIYTLLVFISGNNREISLPILMAIALGYGFREVFKESIKRHLGDRYKQYFYYLTRKIVDTHSHKCIARQWVAIRWLNQRSKKNLSKFIQHVNLSHYHTLNYRCKTVLTLNNFPTNCEQLEESLTLDLVHAIENMLPSDLPIFLNYSRTNQIKKLNPLYKCYLLIKAQQTYQPFVFEFHLNKNNIINLKPLIHS